MTRTRTNCLSLLSCTYRYSLLDAVPLESKMEMEMEMSTDTHLSKCKKLPLSASTSTSTISTAVAVASDCSSGRDGGNHFEAPRSPHCQSPLDKMEAATLPTTIHSDPIRTPVQLSRIYGKEVVVPLPLLFLHVSRVYGNEPSSAVQQGGWKAVRHSDSHDIIFLQKSGQTVSSMHISVIHLISDQWGMPPPLYWCTLNTIRWQLTAPVTHIAWQVGSHPQLFSPYDLSFNPWTESYDVQSN